MDPWQALWGVLSTPEMTELLETSSGHKTLRVFGTFVHSRHDPAKEACRLANAMKQGLSGLEPAVWILVNPGLDYLPHALLQLIPKVKVLILDTWDSRTIASSFPRWCPASGQGLDDFLNLHLVSSDLPALKIHAGKALTDLFPMDTAQLLRSLNESLGRITASLATSDHFFFKWVRNSIHNLSSMSFHQQTSKSKGLLVLAASGPSLESHRALLHQWKEKAILVALPSSLAALSEWGIIPQACFISDGGYWSRYHLEHLDPGTTLYAALRSDTGHRAYRHSRIIPFSCSAVETLLANAAGIRSLPSMPDHGTVAIQALHFMRTFHEGPIVVLGLDFAFNDLASHVRPHSFESNNWVRSTRTNPGHHQLWKGRGSIGGMGWIRNHTHRLFSHGFLEALDNKEGIFQLGPEETRLFPEFDKDSNDPIEGPSLASYQPLEVKPSFMKAALGQLSIDESARSLLEKVIPPELPGNFAPELTGPERCKEFLLRLTAMIEVSSR